MHCVLNCFTFSLHRTPLRRCGQCVMILLLWLLFALKPSSSSASIPQCLWFSCNSPCFSASHPVVGAGFRCPTNRSTGCRHEARFGLVSQKKLQCCVNGYLGRCVLWHLKAVKHMKCQKPYGEGLDSDSDGNLWRHFVSPCGIAHFIHSRKLDSRLAGFTEPINLHCQAFAISRLFSPLSDRTKDKRDGHDKLNQSYKIHERMKQTNWERSVFFRVLLYCIVGLTIFCVRQFCPGPTHQVQGGRGGAAASRLKPCELCCYVSKPARVGNSNSKVCIW